MTTQSVTQYRKRRKISILMNYEKSVMISFKLDCERFLEQFETHNSFSYAVFANIWQLNQFSFIYVDQNFVDLLKVLCQVCFIIVKKYIVFQKSLYIRIGAFYMLYGLFYKQPIEGLVKIRLTLPEYRKIKSLIEEMICKGNLEPAYIFAKMKLDNAFLFVAEPNPISIELSKSIKSFHTDDDTFQSRGSESALAKFKDIFNNDIVQDLKNTCKSYDDLLKKYAGRYPGLASFQSKVIDNLKRAHDNVLIQETNEGEDCHENKEEVKTRRQKLKLRAFRNKKAIKGLDLAEEDEENLESE